MASTNKKSRGKTASANREGATAKKSLPPPSGLTRSPAASSAKASKKKAAAAEEPDEAEAADGQTMPAPGEGEGDGKRKLSLRGAAPWAARHAAKQAAEAAERMREPPRPGSARATLRTPDQADEIKARMNALHQAVARIRLLRKNLAGGFYEMGLLLKNISDQKLFEAKGDQLLRSVRRARDRPAEEHRAQARARSPDLPGVRRPRVWSRGDLGRPRRFRNEQVVRRSRGRRTVSVHRSNPRAEPLDIRDRTGLPEIRGLSLGNGVPDCRESPDAIHRRV